MAKPVVSCAYCARPARLIIEAKISTRPEPGAAAPRGKYVKGVSKRVCEGHAEAIYKLIKKEPK